MLTKSLAIANYARTASALFLTGALLAPYGIALADAIEETIISADRFVSESSEESLSISVIDKEALALIAATHISEAFFQAPGGWVSRGNGQEHLTALRSPVFTGAGACGAFLMTEDLIPLRAAGFCNINQLFDANSEQAARIEVLRGPGSSVYGSNAMHGVINVISQAPSGNEQGSLSLEGGPHAYGRARLTAESGSGDHAFRLAANYTHDGGFKDDSGFNQYKLNLRHHTQFGDTNIDNSLSFSDLDQNTAGFIRGNAAYRDDARKKENPNPDAFRKARSIRAYSRWSFSNNNIDYQLTPYARWNKMKFLQHFLIWQPTERNGHWSVGLQSIGRYQWPDSSVRISAGVDLEYSEGWLTERQSEPFRPHLPAGVHYDYKAKATLLAPFVELSWEISDRTRIEAGLRWEKADYDYRNRDSDGSACEPDVTNCRFFRPADRKDDFSDFSPRIGLIHELGKDQQLYTNVSRGFRAPQATELYRLQNGQSVADLDSEQLDSIEMGYRLNQAKISLEASVYAMKKQDFIFQDSNRQNISGGKSEHRGIEILVDAALTERLKLLLSATWASHRYANEIAIAGTSIKNNEMDTAPDTLGRAALQWEFSGDKGVIEAEWIHLGSYHLDAANSRKYDGHDLFNLRANYRISESWQLSARVTNLADIDYAERADFGFGSERYFVGEPRSLYLSAQLNW